MNFYFLLKTIFLGIITGYFSGQFGIGGGLITTPGIRLLLDQSALVALGTPLVVIIPTAAIGTLAYGKSGFVDLALSKVLALWGLLGVILGSLATKYIPADILMLFTAAIIFWVGLTFFRGRKNPSSNPSKSSFFPISLERRRFWLGGVGFGCGLYSGFLGMGGGLLLIPSLVFIFGLGIKKAFGTSLAINAVYALPGSFIHYFLGHVDLRVGLFLIFGVIPGTYLGAKVAIGLKEMFLRRLFGLFMLAVALYFTYIEVMILLKPVP